MLQFDKHFSLSQANSLIPRVQEIFAQVHDLIEEARNIGKPPKPIFKDPKALGGNGNGNGKIYHFARTREQILQDINELITELTDQGIVIQDVTRGLIDFPAIYDGDEIFLCYEIADGDQIIAWHHIPAGYAGRREIPEDMK